jgi:alkyldihydroxyacetonephosphate synthase
MGVITQAVMRVHKIPAKQEFHGILFPSFEHGVAAIHTMVRKESHPAMVRYVTIPPPLASRVVRAVRAVRVVHQPRLACRLYDPDETRLSFHMKPKSSKLVSAFSELLKKFLERFKNFDLQNICLMIVGVEGEVDNVNFQKKKVFKIGTHRSYLFAAIVCVCVCVCCVCVCVCGVRGVCCTD